MDKTVTYRLLAQALQNYRGREFADLVSMIGSPHTEEMRDSAGVLYSVVITVSWSDSTHRSLLIQGRIDDHNTYRFSNLEEKILVPNPDGVT